jgi:hypothetical protein
MSNNQPINLRDALANHLHPRSLSKSISTLLNSKRKTINFKPYYQRNYVWDPIKATFFIESILLGVEIPPLILFAPFNDKKHLEMVDGRQRFETLKLFFEEKISLKAKGLHKLKSLTGLSFSKMAPEMQRTFTNTTIRTIEFSTKNTLNDEQHQEMLEEKIKKEIFRRYNSGITPLKTLEVQKAQHLSDNFTGIMRDEFNTNPPWLSQFKTLFFTNRANDISTEEAQAKIRELLVLAYFPINIYSRTSNRKELIEQLFYSYIEQQPSQAELDLKDDSDTEEVDGTQRMVFNHFITKIRLLYRFYTTLSPAIAEHHWTIYQGVYWALVVLEANDIDLVRFFDDNVIENLCQFIQSPKHIELFTGADRGMASVTNERFKLLADFFEAQLINLGFDSVDFALHLNSRLRPQNSTNDTADVNSARLIRPDAETTTVEDLITYMKDNEFLIRPSYQRQEVINQKKSSGIIESMLLGIPLPTIFVYRRENGLCEVVDGQQRLLSILGFLGDAKYEDDVERESSKIQKAKKENYRLSRPLKILNYGGKRFVDLDEDLQERLWDFELSIVYIDEENNPNYDPLDLFIRLNNKPYPVKDPSFEMWNSYCERSIIQKIQSLVAKYQDWFYYRKDNKRMENEELVTIFSYLAFRGEGCVAADAFNPVDIYQSGSNPMTFRLQKLKVSNWLEKAEGQQFSAVEQRQNILASIDAVEDFIDKVALLIVHQDTRHNQAQAFDQLLGTKTKARNQRHFYMLWFLLAGISHSVIKSKTTEIAKAAQTFLTNEQSVPAAYKTDVKTIFKDHVEQFWHKYSN